ncbi:FCD domain-containing protein [Pseudooceanicola sp. 216_PA32_1]|uniref:FCD domain-containing protein n=1 Tax=Pseudooceanicola pacificus TaxID=2676438 RepID=A0A844WBU6_9RHOB|nr:GntR family transcriptional regulator [Pseudooceanicola pacificus]MWB78368.1 FCD domain-containing protein [Pseudooceanicola pacificus]
MSKKNTLRDQIEEAILSGKFSPGERLEEKVLAEQYGVSRTPVREALRQLHETGLVEVRERRGTVVRENSPTELVNMFEMMAGLEFLAVRLATRHMTEDDRARIQAAHEACRTARDIGTDAYYYENEAFHQALYRASGNPFLEQQATALHRRLQPYRRLQLRSINRVSQSFEEHEAIVAALFAGDAEGAGNAVWNHVAIQADNFRVLFPNG